MPELRFYFDVVCPYAYLASTRIEALAAAHGATVAWRPILLGGLFREIGAPQLPATAMSAPRARLNLLDMQRWADRWGVPLTMPADHPRRTVAAMRLLVGVGDGPQRRALAAALYRAYWAEGRDVSDRAVVDAIAREHGVDPAVIDSQAAREGLFSTTAEAARLGAFGVPTIALDGETIWWGADRLCLVEEALGGRPRRPGERPADAPPAAASGATIDFFHDFASPFSYLASTQIARVAAAYGATLRWRPILLGALFRELGTADVPLLGMNAAKQAYVRRDLDDWAAFWRVPFRFPSHFPIRTVAPLRVALVAPELTSALYEAAWSKDQAIDEPQVLARIIAENKRDPVAVLEEASSPTIKEALRENTAAAELAGCCGVPSMVVTPAAGGEPIVLWGQDRLEMLEWVLEGWRPPRG
ncbi:MAG: 2-hydroxychromene-2-carboxylate isomerase [Myxococcales bacterium]|nr:2-hydroxychromene-2-carboxylate isomerase [Myxococcales bacterium]